MGRGGRDGVRRRRWMGEDVSRKDERIREGLDKGEAIEIILTAS